MVWQVRQALLNASCPSSPAVALPAGVCPSDGWDMASMAAASETVSAPEVMRCAHAKERLQTSRVNVSSHGAFRRCVELGRPQQPGFAFGCFTNRRAPQARRRQRDEAVLLLRLRTLG